MPGRPVHPEQAFPIASRLHDAHVLRVTALDEPEGLLRRSVEPRFELVLLPLIGIPHPL
jgi:hypothetical protein